MRSQAYAATPSSRDSSAGECSKRLHLVMTRLMGIVGVLALPVLFACESTTDLISPWETRVEGLVLEYADSTRTTTIPVSGARVSLFLAEGAEAYCGAVLCDIEFPEETTTNGLGGFVFRLVDPAACTMRVRADLTRGSSLDGTVIRKTAEAPRVAPDCQEGRTEGPTLILESAPQL